MCGRQVLVGEARPRHADGCAQIVHACPGLGGIHFQHPADHQQLSVRPGDVTWLRGQPLRQHGEARGCAVESGFRRRQRTPSGAGNLAIGTGQRKCSRSRLRLQTRLPVDHIDIAEQDVGIGPHARVGVGGGRRAGQQLLCGGGVAGLQCVAAQHEVSERGRFAVLQARHHLVDAVEEAGRRPAAAAPHAAAASRRAAVSWSTATTTAGTWPPVRAHHDRCRWRLRPPVRRPVRRRRCRRPPRGAATRRLGPGCRRPHDAAAGAGSGTDRRRPPSGTAGGRSRSACAAPPATTARSPWSAAPLTPVSAGPRWLPRRQRPTDCAGPAPPGRPPARPTPPAARPALRSSPMPVTAAPGDPVCQT